MWCSKCGTHSPGYNCDKCYPPKNIDKELKAIAGTARELELEKENKELRKRIRASMNSFHLFSVELETINTSKARSLWGHAFTAWKALSDVVKEWKDE